MHRVIDNMIPESLVRAAAAEWPDDHWPFWHVYEDATARKRASRCGLDELPPACRAVLLRMAELDVPRLLQLPPSFPDLSLHGSGLHELPAGGFLRTHLDSTHHPSTGWGRAASMVLCVNDEWRNDWGGELQVNSERIQTAHNRMVVMPTTDESWHGVGDIKGPVPRRTLALFWWTQSAVQTTRPKAVFA